MVALGSSNAASTGTGCTRVRRPVS
uniref:Uncharacterized protein n=1 Tax=Anopheles epiroticus TaxID=199890 RepID=A0A182PB22_9DIPT